MPGLRRPTREVGTLFDIVIFFAIGAALIGFIANSSTGITIAHTGFTPNPNLTASPGAVPITQIIPLVFVAFIVVAGWKKTGL